MQIKELFLDSQLWPIFQLFKQKYHDLEYDLFCVKINQFIKSLGRIITLQQDNKTICAAVITEEKGGLFEESKIFINELIIDKNYNYETTKTLIEKLKLDAKLKNKKIICSCKTIDRDLHSFISNRGFILAEFTFIFE